MKPKPNGLFVAFATCAALLVGGEAGAVIQGQPSGLTQHTVRIHRGDGKALCSGVAIGREHVVTARHCSGRGALSVAAGGERIRVIGTGVSAIGISVRGDAIILTLAKPLPPAIAPLTVAEGEGPFVIAGYGTSVERRPSVQGTLHEASLVHAHGNKLVDPNRSGNISASACFGDSGGPVVRMGPSGPVLVGVITRASHPHPRIACGHLTHYAPVFSGDNEPEVTTAAIADPAERVESPRRKKRVKHVARHHRYARR